MTTEIGGFFCTDALIPTAAVKMSKNFAADNHRERVSLRF